MRLRTGSLPAMLAVLLLGAVFAQAQDYPELKEVRAQAAKAAKAAGGSSEKLAETAGGNELQIVTVGENPGLAPAVLIVANLEGSNPLVTVAALRWIERLSEENEDLKSGLTWYVVPVGNPDGFARLFDSPLSANALNGRSVNDDSDDLYNEDGVEDLNGDGFITLMRQLHPDGEWVEVDGGPLLRKADASRGEVGKWRLLPEGIDNDGDGEINEDGPGGVNPAVNFPHEFEHYKVNNGLYAASEVESRAILQFAFNHPEIELILSFGRVNTIAKNPPTDRRSAAAQNEYEVPKRWAEYVGLEVDKKYPLDEIVEAVRNAFGNPDISEDRILQWIGAGAMVNPDRDDLTWWKVVSQKYGDAMQLAGMDAERIDAPLQMAGSFEEWGYYQFGVPSFGLDFWTPEAAPDKKSGPDVISADSVASLENDALLALSDSDLSDLLTANRSTLTVDEVRAEFEAGTLNAKRFADHLRRSAKRELPTADETEAALYAYDPSTFVAWTSYDHPTLGKVEIGGFKPWAETTPKLEDAQPLIDARLGFLPQLTAMLPKLSIGKVEVTEVSDGVYRVDTWVENRGFLPYPTHQGQRSQRPVPAVLTLGGKGVTFLEGRPRNVLGLLEGSGGSEKATWLVGGTKGTKVSLELKSAIPIDRVTVTLKEGGGR